MAGRGTDYWIKMGADISDLEGKLSKARQSIENFGNDAQVTAKGMDSLFKAEGLDSLISQFDSVGNAVKKMGNVMSNSSTGINQQLRVIQQAATAVLTEFRNLSEAEQQTAGGRALYSYYQQLLAKGSELRDNIADVKGAINAMADDARVFKAMGQGVQVMASSFQVAAGAASVFGVSQEKIAAVQQKLTSIIAITNGLQQIQVLLQKESALMQTINLVRTQGWAAALGVKTAAQIADTAAIEANTVATEANSAAIKRNPIGLIVTLAVAAGVAIYELTDGFTSLTGEMDSATKATMAFNDEVGKQSDQLASNIALINNMRNDMLTAGNNAEQQRKVFERYRKKQVEVGLATKNAGEMHLAVVRSTNVIIEACNLRMKAAAAEAAMQVQLGKVLSKVSEIREKAMKGEAIGAKELEAIGANIGALMAKGLKPQQTNLNALLFGDGYKYTIPKEQIDAIMEDISNQAIDYALNGIGKDIQKVRDAVNAQLKDLQLQHPEIKWDEDTDATGKNTAVTDKNTAAKKNNQKASQAEKAELEKLDEQYNSLIKTIGSVKKETEEGARQFSQLRARIQSTLMQKINLMPTNTIGDIEDLTKTIQTLLEWLDKGSEEFEKFSQMLQHLRVVQATQKLSLVDTNTLEGAQAAQQIIGNIVKILPSGSKELETWSEKLQDATDHARQLQNEVNGIQKGSLADLRQQIAEIDKQLQNENLELPMRATLLLEKEELQQKINDITDDVIVEVQRPIDLTFDYKKTDLEKLEHLFSRVSERRDYLGDLVKGGKLASWQLEEVTKELGKLNDEYSRLRVAVKRAEINRDIEEYRKNLQSLRENATFGIVDGIDSLYNSITSLSDTLSDDKKNPFEKMMAGVKMLASAYKTAKDLINTFQEISAAIRSLEGANEALNSLGAAGNLIGGADQTTQVASQAAATTALATAEGAASTAAQMLAASQTELMTTSLATVAGIKALSNAYLELAASEYLAAHASIPFAGYAVGAGFATAAKALVMSMQAFANGGIVGGNRLFGDTQYVRINSGEMVLSGSQQKKLFNLLDGGYSTLKGSNGSEVTFKVKGRDLIAVMNNQNDKMGKIK